MIKEIKQKSFKELDVLVPKIGGISDILKTIIFFDKIEDEIKMAQYLRSLLPQSLCKKRDYIIQIFSPTENLSNNSFLWKNLKIEIFVS